MDSEVKVAAVKLVLGGHLAAVAPRRSCLSICDVKLKQVDLWIGDEGSQGSHIQSSYCVIYREDPPLKTHDWRSQAHDREMPRRWLTQASCAVYTWFN